MNNLTTPLFFFVTQWLSLNLIFSLVFFSHSQQPDSHNHESKQSQIGRDISREKVVLIL
jgi:hypothetical protein